MATKADKKPGSTIEASAEQVETVNDAPPDVPTAEQVAVEPRGLDEKQTAKLRNATTAEIRAALKGQLNEGWRLAFDAELKRREDELDVALGIQRAAATKQYRVTKNTTVAHEGMLTQINEGSIVTAETHDLAKLEQWGVPLAEVTGAVRTEVDELGRQHTVLK